MARATDKNGSKQQHDPRIIALVDLLAKDAAITDYQAECLANQHGKESCKESPSTPDIHRTFNETNP